MNTKLLSINTSTSIFTWPCRNYVCHRKLVSMRPTMSVRPSHESSKTVYHDSWLELLAINYVSRNLQTVSGIMVEKEGYDGLVETCKALTLKYTPVQQRQLSLDCLKRGIPTLAFPLMKALVPQNRFVREFLARCACLFFVWLIGPSKVKESELNGKIEKNVVHIKKCRFLESTECVGMCTNICKFPSQAFIKDTLGVPVTMVPNYEDMSCEMIFGEEPLAPEHDPATKQPCYNLCKIRKRHSENCSYNVI